MGNIKVNTPSTKSIVPSRPRALAAMIMAGASGASLYAPAVLAQANGTALEEVVVTAQRRSESMMDVPISMTAFTNKGIEANMIKGVEGYVARTPNISISQGATRSGNVSTSSHGLAIRGISNVGGNASSYGFYIDDFNVTRATLNPQLIDIERIEILRGPQGTFFGRNASGGVISVNTNKPNDKLEGDFSMEYREVDGSGLGTWETTGTVNIPVSESFMLRASGLYTDGDGYAENETAPGGTNGVEYKYARLGARILPSDAITVDLNATFSDEQQDDLGLISTGIYRSSIGPFLCDVLVSQGAQSACPFDIGKGLYPDNRRYYYHNNPLNVEDEYQLYNAKIVWMGDNFTFTSITGYIDTEFHREGEIDFSSVDQVNEDFENIDRSSISQEFRLQSSGNDAFHWIVGGIWAKDTLDEHESINFGTDPTTNEFFGVFPHFRIEEITNDQTITSLAVFAEGTWDVSDKLSLTLGARWSEDEIDQKETKVDFETPLPDQQAEDSWSDISPKLAATYQVSEDTNVYATIAKGWKSGGINLELTNPDDPVNNFNEETLWNYELGVKSELLDRRLRVNLALFHIQWEDIQVNASRLIEEDGELRSVSGVSNASEATSKGVEVEINALPTPQLELGFNLGYLDGEFDSYDNATTNFGDFDLTGQPLPKAPEWTVSANAEYSMDFGGGWEGFIRAEYEYQDQLYYDINGISGALGGSSFPFLIPDHEVWNFRAGLENDSFRVVAFVENAFDEEYYTSNFDFGFINGTGVVPSYRVYGVKLVANFGQN